MEKKKRKKRDYFVEVIRIYIDESNTNAARVD